MDKRTQEEITRIGNPARPQGEEGRLMLERMNNSHSPLTEWAFSLLQLGDDHIVLDIGCGGGAALKRASGCVKNGRLYGVDYSPVSVSLACENNDHDISIGKMHITKSSVKKLPFDNDTFDRIYTIESFYFWTDPVESLKEVRRVLKKSGAFMIAAEIYSHDGLSKETIENVIRYKMNNPTPQEFEKMLTDAGFSDVHIHTKPETDWICVIAYDHTDQA